MKLNTATGLHEGNGVMVRVQLDTVKKKWSIYIIDPKYQRNWLNQPVLVPTYSIPWSDCLSAAIAIEKWLATRPFKVQ